MAVIIRNSYLGRLFKLRQEHYAKTRTLDTSKMFIHGKYDGFEENSSNIVKDEEFELFMLNIKKPPHPTKKTSD